MSINKKAIYSGSFDPPTYGHLWVISQASILFDEVVVAIGANSDKLYKFSARERIHMLETVTRDFANVKVENLNNRFLVDFAKQIDANYIVRGIRNVDDYEFERKMRYINSDLYANIKTVFLIPPREYIEVSSSMINGIIGLDGWENIVNKYLPKQVYEFVLSKYSKNKK